MSKARTPQNASKEAVAKSHMRCGVGIVEMPLKSESTHQDGQRDGRAKVLLRLLLTGRRVGQATARALRGAVRARRGAKVGG